MCTAPSPAVSSRCCHSCHGAAILFATVPSASSTSLAPWPTDPPRCTLPASPPRRPFQQRPAQWRPQASSSLATTAPLPARSSSVSSPDQQQLSHQGASASNKPHLAEKSTPVWLAIWHIWAGFANSQLLPDAAALYSIQGLQRSGNSSAQTSASLHPPASLRLRVLPFTRGMVAHGLQDLIVAPASNISVATAPRPATNLIRRREALRFG